MAIFYIAWRASKLRYYGDVIHSFDWKSAVEHDGGVKMRDSVPSARYSTICNVLRQWKTSLIPIYRVYRLYDKGDCLEDIKHGSSSSASFMAFVEECISVRQSRKFEEGLNTKVKLDIYKQFGKSVKYLHGICDAGSRLLFKVRSGTHGLNEELGRHRGGREGKTECSLCGNECENVCHVLWECSVYSSTRASFMKKLQALLEDGYEDFESLENVEKSSIYSTS